MNGRREHGIGQRQTEKNIAELKEVADLQNQEISRLKLELQEILHKIHETEDHSTRMNIILRNKITQLRNEILNSETRKSILISHTNSSFSQVLSELNQKHQEELMQIKLEHESKIPILSLKNNIENEHISNVVNMIDDVREEIAKSLGAKNEILEMKVQTQLNKLNIEISENKKREQILKDSIDSKIKEKERIDSEFNTYADQAKILNQKREQSIKLDKDHANEQLIMQHLTQMTELNKIKEENESVLFALRKQISETRDRMLMMSNAIETGITPESKLIAELELEKDNLEETLSHEILSEDKSGEKQLMKKIQQQYLDRKYLIKRMEAYKLEKENVLKEKEKILEEVKRLDFMVFGRGGKYQFPCKKKPTRRVL